MRAWNRSALRFGVVLLLSAAACERPVALDDYAARLGSESLSEAELAAALDGLTVEMDSADAARQVVEQWVTNQLLLTEARRRGIDREPEVRANVEEAERAVLVDALLARLYQEETGEPSEAELADYFAQNQERLRLVEPYVRVRYLVLDDLQEARTARTRLNQLEVSDQAGWDAMAEEVSDEPELSRALALSLVPETRAFSEFPLVASAVQDTRAGRTSTVIGDRGGYHVVQVLERIPAGTLPERSWIESSLRQQLQIESRKLLYARLVQQLRNEALAREQLEIR